MLMFYASVLQINITDLLHGAKEITTNYVRRSQKRLGVSGIWDIKRI